MMEKFFGYIGQLDLVGAVRRLQEKVNHLEAKEAARVERDEQAALALRVLLKEFEKLEHTERLEREKILL